jgi:hypothetical protein
MTHFQFRAGLCTIAALALSLGGCNQDKAAKSTASTSLAVEEEEEFPVEGYPAEVVDALERRTADILATSQALLSPEDVPEFESVISIARLWQPGTRITVAFQGGSSQLRGQIVEAVRPWTSAANLVLDFGAGAGSYREWTSRDRRYAAQIRISFNRGGYWSFIGLDAVDSSVAKPNMPSMNFGGFDRRLPADWRAIVLHEFGHALGFAHEHQSPRGECEREFRWEDDPGYQPKTGSIGQFVIDDQGRRPGIYRVLGGPPNNWGRDKVNHNLRKLPYSTDLVSSAFDRMSIMKYYFPPWMFRSGGGSACFSLQNAVLSTQDSVAAADNYPRLGPEIQAALVERGQWLQQALRDLEWTRAQRNRLKNALEETASERESVVSEP